MMDRNIINSTVEADVKLYKNIYIKDSTIHSHSSVGDDTTIVSSEIEGNVAINRRNFINNSNIASYTYTGINNNIGYTNIGKFCSLGKSLNIGGNDHNYKRVSTMPLSRYAQLSKSIIDVESNIEPKRCIIGNDVWIGDGACVLSKAKISDGVIIGAGAVVTKDIPPYAIAVGVPAKVIGFRFEKGIIEELLKIKWWDWPEKYITDNAELIFKRNLSQKIIDELKMCLCKINDLN